MKVLSPLVLLLCLCLPARADLKVRGAQTYKPYDPIVLKAADVTSAKAQFLWDVSDGAQVVEAGDTLYVWAPPGTYRVQLTAVDFDTKKIERARFAFTVEGAAPTPPTPPTPPAPTPPAPVKGLRVLIVYDSSALSAMPPAQRTILTARSVHDWLDARCAVGPDGKTHEWRVWDKDTDPRGEAAVWGQWLARPHAAVPWVVIGGDSGVAYEGPLPGTVADTLALFGKYAPPSLRKAG